MAPYATPHIRETSRAAVGEWSRRWPHPAQALPAFADGEVEAREVVSGDAEQHVGAAWARRTGMCEPTSPLHQKRRG
jgi:hypothetical protein